MIIPSVDLQDKKAVQLKQGRDKMLENNDPVGLARDFNFFSELAVIDLDAAIRKDGVNNEDVIAAIADKTDCRAGGGIRSLEKAKRIISLGVTKVIIGTSAFKDGSINRPFLEELTAELGSEKIILAVDTYGGEIVTHGWRSKSGIMLLDVVGGLEKYASELLFTCVEKEGMLQGAALDQVRALKSATSLEITAAGGISTLEEIRELSAMRTNCQLGMSIYTGKISLADALAASIDWSAESVRGIVHSSTTETKYEYKAGLSDFRETVKTRSCCFPSDAAPELQGFQGKKISKIRNSRDNTFFHIFI